MGLITSFPGGNGGSEITVDSELSTTSENPVQNKVITTELNKKANSSSVPTQLSQLTADSTHRTVTDTEKSTWNGKQNTLTAGANITINNDQISASGVGGYSKHFTVTPQTKIQINCTNVYQTIYVSLFYGGRALKRITLYEYGSTLYEDTIAQSAAISLEATRISAGKFRITIPANSQVDLFSCESFTYQTIS